MHNKFEEHNLIKKLTLLVACFMLSMAQSPLSPIANPKVQDLIKGKNKSGIIIGASLGLPSTPIQYLHGQRFENTTSYGYGFIIGYQDFARIINPLPRNFAGARASFEFKL